MTNATTIINGYLVELDTDDTGTQCCVTYREKTGAQYFASLAALMDTGELEDRDNRPRRVPASTIERITDWALERGY